MSVHFGTNKIAKLYLGNTKIKEAYYGSILVYKSTVTLTINPEPANATVTFNIGIISGNTCTVAEGTVVTYTVSHSNCITYTGTATVNRDMTVRVALAHVVQFSTSSSIQTFTVPSKVSSIHIECVGSKGQGTNGGKGGKVVCDLATNGGETLYVMVGAQSSGGISAPQYNAADIRLGGKEYNNRIIVAGGGGNQANSDANGGAGGGLTGGAGGSNNATYAGTGKGGTQSAGGAGGAGSHGSRGHHHNGNAGTFGLGGAGSYETNYEGPSGAGGAGWYGGGAGAGSWNKAGAFTAGGGGGSSYTNASCSNVVHTQGYQNGNGYVKMLYYVGE